MSTQKYPLIEKISFKDLFQKCKSEYSLARYKIAKEHLFVSDKTLQRLSDGEKEFDKDICKGMLDLIKRKSGGTSALFVSKMIEWYPELSGYATESEIREIITANLNGTASYDESLNSVTPRLSSIQFLQSCLDDEFKVKCVKMAYQTGWLWFDDRKRTNLLIHISKSGIPIQVIANPESVIKDIAYTMSDPAMLLRYMGFNETLATWHKYECAYKNIHLRISRYPILRKSLIVEFEDGSSKAIFGDYAYGSPVKYAPPYLQLANSDTSFEYYYNEFQYLWDKSVSYSKWYKSLPKPEEIIPPNDYLLLYPSHEIAAETHREWIYSALSIGENNEVKLRVNISNLEKISDPKTSIPCEYEYTGRLKSTGKHLFISLYDDAQQENITLTLFHRYPDNSRFFGIMTGLSPLGQPAAFKCACIGRSAVSRINFQALKKLLCSQNKDWNNTLMILEQRDINLFYSERIFYNGSREN